MPSEARQDCVVCGENQFEYLDGFQYCAVCGAKCERYVDVDEVGEENLEDVAAPSFALSKLKAEKAKKTSTKRRKLKYDYDSDYDDLDSVPATENVDTQAESTPKSKRKKLRSAIYDNAKPFLLADAFTVVIRKHVDALCEQLEREPGLSLNLPSLNPCLNEMQVNDCYNAFGCYQSDWRSKLRTCVYTMWKLFLRKRGDAFTNETQSEDVTRVLTVRRARELHAVPVTRPLFATANRAQRLTLGAKRVRIADERDVQRAETSQSDWTTAESGTESDCLREAVERKRKRSKKRLKSLRPDVRNALRNEEAVNMAATARRFGVIKQAERAALMSHEKPLTMLYLGALFCAPELGVPELVRFARCRSIRYVTQASLLPSAVQLFHDDMKALTTFRDVVPSGIERDAKFVAASLQPEINKFTQRSFDLQIVRVLDQLNLPAEFYFFVAAVKKRAAMQVAKAQLNSKLKNSVGKRKKRRGQQKQTCNSEDAEADVKADTASRNVLEFLHSIVNNSASEAKCATLFDGEIVALAFVCVALRLAFGLDGHTEVALSRLANLQRPHTAKRNFVFTDWAVKLNVRALGQNVPAGDTCSRLERVRSESWYAQRQFDRPESLRSFADQFEQLRSRLTSQRVNAPSSQPHVSVNRHLDTDFRDCTIDFLLDTERPAQSSNMPLDRMEHLLNERAFRFHSSAARVASFLSFDDQHDPASATFNWLLKMCCCMFQCASTSLQSTVNQVIMICFSEELARLHRALDVAQTLGCNIDRPDRKTLLSTDC